MKRRLSGFAAAVLLFMLVLPPGRAFAQAGPSLEVHDQHLTDGVVTIDAVTASEPGWVDIHREAEVQGNPGEVIGYAHVDPGETNYLHVQIDPDLASPVLYAVLHADRGQPGVFEFPGPDEPIQVNGAAITAPLRVLDQPGQPSTEQPWVEVRDQWMRGGQVIVGRVVTAQPGWVDIHAEAETAGNPGPVIGYAPIAAGETRYVRVPVDGALTTPVLYAVLHLDGGEAGTFEFPGPDVPVQVEGRTMVAPFRLLGVEPVEPAAATPAPAHIATPAVVAQVTAAATNTMAPTPTRQATVTATATTAPTQTPPATATPTPAPTATSTLTRTATSTPVGASTAGVPGGAAGGGQEAEPDRLPVTGGRFPAAQVVGLGALLALTGLLLRSHGRRRSRLPTDAEG